MDIVYYFRPIIFPEDTKPLEGMIIVISTYEGDERVFLVKLAECLGAEVQDAYKRSVQPLLVCPPEATENPKFKAALKWSKFLHIGSA